MVVSTGFKCDSTYMHYVVQTGGKQYIVKKGDVIAIERIASEAGTEVSLQLLAVLSEKGALELSEKKSTSAKVVEHFRGEKLRIFKRKRRKRYQRMQGHRQELTKVEIL